MLVELATSMTKQGQITVPVKIRRLLNLKPSDKIQFIKEDDKVYIKPLRNISSLKGVLKSKKRFTNQELENLIAGHIADEYRQSLRS